MLTTVGFALAYSNEDLVAAQTNYQQHNQELANLRLEFEKANKSLQEQTKKIAEIKKTTDLIEQEMNGLSTKIKDQSQKVSLAQSHLQKVWHSLQK